MLLRVKSEAEVNTVNWWETSNLWNLGHSVTTKTLQKITCGEPCEGGSVEMASDGLSVSPWAPRSLPQGVLSTCHWREGQKRGQVEAAEL